MPKKILIVDDEPTTVALVNFLMKTSNFQTTTAQDGEEGLQKAVVEKPDLVVLDIQMPKMDGYTFLVELRKIEEMRKVPVIMLTSREKMQDLFRMEGVKDYFIKPVNSEDFLKKVKELLTS